MITKIEFHGHVYYVDNTLPFDLTASYIWYGESVCSTKAYPLLGGSYEDAYRDGQLHRVIATDDENFNLPRF